MRQLTKEDEIEHWTCKNELQGLLGSAELLSNCFSKHAFQNTTMQHVVSGSVVTIWTTNLPVTLHGPARVRIWTVPSVAFDTPGACTSLISRHVDTTSWTSMGIDTVLSRAPWSKFALCPTKGLSRLERACTAGTTKIRHLHMKDVGVKSLDFDTARRW
jgi:hypothetical protein